MDAKTLTTILADHAVWLVGNGGKCADLWNANLWNADLQSANLRGANLRNADLRNADLQGADLQSANLWNADLQSANLQDANLRCFGNMREIRALQIASHPVGYTATHLQIGCQRHSIDTWRKLATSGLSDCDFVDSDDKPSLKAALPLLLEIVDQYPATPTGRENTV